MPLHGSSRLKPLSEDVDLALAYPQPYQALLSHGCENHLQHMACLSARPDVRACFRSRAFRGRGHRQMKAVASFQNPFAALGLSATADAEQIKKAYRKLALQWHPDVSKQEGSEAVFLQLTEAYEFLTGKLRGNDATEKSTTDWDWHDWYWNFRINRTWKQQQAGNEPSQPRPAPAPRTNIREQLAGLRQRAAIRATKARNSQSADTLSRSSIDDDACELQGQGYRSDADAGSASEVEQEQICRTPTAGAAEDSGPLQHELPGIYHHHEAAPQHTDHDSGVQGVHQAAQHSDEQQWPSSTQGTQRRKFVAHSETRDHVRHQLAGLRRKAMIKPRSEAAADL